MQFCRCVIKLTTFLLMKINGNPQQNLITLSKITFSSFQHPEVLKHLVCGYIRMCWARKYECCLFIYERGETGFYTLEVGQAASTYKIFTNLADTTVHKKHCDSQRNIIYPLRALVIYYYAKPFLLLTFISWYLCRILLTLVQLCIYSSCTRSQSVDWFPVVCYLLSFLGQQLTLKWSTIRIAGLVYFYTSHLLPFLPKPFRSDSHTLKFSLLVCFCCTVYTSYKPPCIQVYNIKISLRSNSACGEQKLKNIDQFR